MDLFLQLKEVTITEKSRGISYKTDLFYNQLWSANFTQVENVTLKKKSGGDLSNIDSD